MNTEVTEYIENVTLEQREIMQILREIIHEAVPDVVEEFKWSRPIFKATKDFAYLKSNKSYVTLGFTKGFDKLNDPDNLLEGTGKTMRHIKLKSTTDIDRKLITEWLIIITND